MTIWEVEAMIVALVLAVALIGLAAGLIGNLRSHATRHHADRALVEDGFVDVLGEELDRAEAAAWGADAWPKDPADRAALDAYAARWRDCAGHFQPGPMPGDQTKNALAAEDIADRITEQLEDILKEEQ